MLFRKLIGAISVAAALTMPALAQDKDLLATVKERGELVVGTEMQFPPFDFIENGKQVGFNADLFAEIGKELGVKVKFIDLPWSNVLPGLEAGKFDMVAGPNTLTAARLEKYYFNLPISGGAISIMKLAKNTGFTSAEDIEGRTFGAQRETVSATKIREVGEGKNITVRDYGDNNQAYADLVAGRLDGVVAQSTNLYYAAKLREGMFEVLQPAIGPMAWFSYVGRRDENSLALMKAIDEAILKVSKDGRMAEIQLKWFGVTMDLPETLPNPQM
ncbi:polar amino acid transport system substrate-binding protein [Mesorhizobium soli]|uniref:transporter substrate-binding domain-containing protein n=1 Tax=Pseudaminobacter soli (ex Li et al. 2025) TaxID=1295366 RepID=UPI0024745D3A|nr:transporter substrate-binding domain-containing protein [Mesorhizobium soli]MDH6231775.1 polar amino acid transport system substrate-binding protein [Mesorhizobium soli]